MACGAAIQSWWQRVIGDLPDTSSGATLADPGASRAVFIQEGFTAPHWEPFTVTIHATPDQVWADYLANLYLIRALSAAARGSLAGIATAALNRHTDSDGRVRFDIALRLLTTRKAADAGE